MTPESDEAYQRHRLRTLDAAFLWSVSLFSVMFSVANAVLGQTYAVAALPLFIPLFAIPLTDGFIMGSVVKESLAWRARGWATFVVGIIVAVNYVAAELLFFAVREPQIVTVVVIVELGATAILLYLSFRFAAFVNRLYGTDFRAIRARQDIDIDSAEFVHGGVIVGVFTGLGCAAWSFALIGLPFLPPLVYLASIIVGLFMWLLFATTSSGRRPW